MMLAIGLAGVGLALAMGALMAGVRRRRQDAQLHTDRFLSFAASASDWLWEQDHRLRFTYVSDGRFLVDRLQPSDALGKTREELGTILSDPRGASWFDALLADRQAFRDVEFVRTDNSGRLLIMAISGNPVFDGTGTFRGYRGVGRDITEVKRIGNENRLARLAFDQAKEAIIVTDADNSIVMVNQAFERVTQYAAAEVIGKNPRILSSRRQGGQFYLDLWSCLREAGYWEGELWNRRKNGEIYPEWLSISLIRDEQGQVANHLAIFSDISERKESEEEIYRVSHFDPLTGLPNRRLMRNRGEHALEQARLRRGRLAIAVLDLDDLRAINNTMGYEAGDQLLLEFKHRIGGLLPEEATLARQGGDEFAVLVPSFQEVDELVRLADRLMEGLDAPLVVDEGEIRIGCSMGLALYPDDGATFTDLLRRADAAMHRAKRHGKHRYSFYEVDLDEKLKEHLRFEMALKRAIHDGVISVAYQPIIDLATGDVACFEALARWHDPEFGEVAPSRFIPVAEATGQIGALGMGVLSAVCGQMRIWRDLGLELVPIAVNLSAAQFADAGLVPSIVSLCRDAGVPLDRLQLEITEAVLMNDPDRAIGQIDALRAQGVRISIDDFGTGYSSLAYLRQIRIDKLKIDRSFVAGVPENADAAIIMKAVIDLAHALGLTTVAEGVESREQRDWLSNCGCDQAQGFLFARPLPPAAAAGCMRLCKS